MATTSEGRRTSIRRGVLRGLAQVFGILPMPRANLPVTIAWEKDESGQWRLVIRIAFWFIPKFPR